ncbi:MAG: AAA family ATPase [Cypionkella sp.]|nr:AAA family ATPase [Cypionkella sp.]
MEAQSLAPNASDISRHLHMITARWAELGQPAMLELRAFAENRSPQTAKFRPEWIDEPEIGATAWAAEVNAMKMNVYAVINPIRYGYTGSAKDTDIIGSLYLWADCDDADAARNVKSFVGPKWTAAVTTGTIPSARAHVYWELESPCTDLAAWRAMQSDIAATFKSDKSVINPSRIMRLSGTVTYPDTKKRERGYVPEISRLRTEYDDGRAPIAFDRMRQVFAAQTTLSERAKPSAQPPSQGGFEIQTAAMGNGVNASNDEVLDLLSYISPDIGYADWLAVLMGLHDKFEGSDEGLEIAVEWSAKGAKYVAGEVEAKWDTFTPGKGSGFGTIAEFARQGGADLSAVAKHHRPMSTPVHSPVPQPTTVTKQNKTELGADFDDPQIATPTWPTVFDAFDSSTITPREWIYGRHYLRKFVSVLASPGGIGKTSLQVVEAIAIATGRPLLGERVEQQTNVWIVNLEDPMDEMQRRINAAMLQYNITAEELRGKLFVDAGREFSLRFAVQTRDGVHPNKALVEYLAERIPELGIGAVFIDPFVSAHAVSENDNMAIGAVVSEIRELADKANCAIGLVHHTRKTNGEDVSVDSIRGAGSLIGAARAARVINPISAEKAMELGFKPDDVKGIFRIDDAKANLAPPSEAAAYRQMIGKQIGNGEWIGVAVKIELPDGFEGITEGVANSILSEIDSGIEDEDGNAEFYTSRPQDKERWAGSVIMAWNFGNPENAKNAAQAGRIIKKWIETGMLEQFDYKSERQRKMRKGLRKSGRAGPSET